MKKAGIIILCSVLLAGCGSKNPDDKTAIETTAAAQSSVSAENEMPADVITEKETILSSEPESSGPDLIFFDEVPDIPTPDSVLKGVAFDKKESDEGIIKYTYILNENEDISNRLLDEYIIILNCIETYSVDVQNNVIYVLSGDTLISAMMAGYENGSYFLMITFQG